MLKPISNFSENNSLLDNRNQVSYYTSSERSEIVIQLANDTPDNVESCVRVKTIMNLGVIVVAGISSLPLVIITSINQTEELKLPLFFQIAGVGATAAVNFFPSLLGGKVTWDGFVAMLKEKQPYSTKLKKILAASGISFILSFPTLGLVIAEIASSEEWNRFLIPLNWINELIYNAWSYFEIRDRSWQFYYNYLLPIKYTLSLEKKYWYYTLQVKHRFIELLENSQKYITNKNPNFLIDESFNRETWLENQNQFFAKLPWFIEMGQKWQLESLDIPNLAPPQQIFFYAAMPILKWVTALLSLISLNATACDSSVGLSALLKALFLNSSSLKWLEDSIGWSVTLLTMLPQYATGIIYSIGSLQIFDILTAWGQGKTADLGMVARNHPYAMSALSLVMLAIGPFSWFMNDKFMTACPYNPMLLRVLSNIENTKIYLIYLFAAITKMLEMYDRNYGSDSLKKVDQLNLFLDELITNYKFMPLPTFASELITPFASPLVEKFPELQKALPEIKKECVDHGVEVGEASSEIITKKQKTTTSCFSCWPFTLFCGSKEPKRRVEFEMKSDEYQPAFLK